MDRKTFFHTEYIAKKLTFPRRVHREEMNIPTQSTYGRNEHSHAGYIGKK
jgi:hypothetical protein